MKKKNKMDRITKPDSLAAMQAGIKKFFKIYWYNKAKIMTGKESFNSQVVGGHPMATLWRSTGKTTK